MNSRRWLQGFRLFWGVLLAPALVPLTLHASLALIIARAHPDISDVTVATLRVFELTFGVGMVYLCVLCFGIPYVVLLRRAGRLSLRAIMLPTVILSWLYPVIVYFSLQKDYPFASTVAGLCVPGVLLAGLCFYVIAVWRSHPDDAEVSLLLETYSGRKKSPVQA